MVERYVPKVKGTKQRSKAPWWHKGLERKVKRKHKAWKEYVEIRNAENYRK